MAVFEAKLQAMLTKLGPDRFMAAYLATGARNGVEDLHAAGAFTDDEAPELNRSMRNALYEAWVVLREGTNDKRGNAEAFMNIGWGLLDDVDETILSGEPMHDILTACCYRTAQNFMLDKGESEEAADAFAHAAASEMRDYYRIWDAVASGNAPEREMREFDFSVGIMAEYWEPAELSPEFMALLEAG